VRRGLRLTLAALLLPAIGIVVLTQADPVRRPLTEQEAALGVAMNPVAPPRESAASGFPEALPSASAVALARIGPTVLGGGELALRFAGLIAGALALGATVRLGERLFATRVGVIAAGLLLAVPAARALLGTRLTVDPFVLLPMLVSLAATRNLARAKVSLHYAGIGAGIAIAVAGGAALWLPALILIWLHRLRGLDLRSFGAVVAWTLGPAGLAVAVAVALVGGNPIGDAASLWSAGPGQVSLASLGLGFLPILPLAILGAWHLPPHWTQSESLGFIGWWTLTSGLSALLTGSIVGPTLALLLFVAALIAWAIDRAPRALSWSGALAAVVLFATLPRGPVTPGGSLELWAARETARFVKHVLPDDRRVAAAEGAAQRIAFYSRRDVAALRSAGDLTRADYAVVDRAALRTLGGRLSMDRRLTVGPTSMWVLAQFGPWVVARIDPPGDPATRPLQGSATLPSDPLPTSIDH
jgi:hypothetical protein